MAIFHCYVSHNQRVVISLEVESRWSPDAGCSFEVSDVPGLVMANSSPWFFDGPNRNRWFTY